MVNLYRNYLETKNGVKSTIKMDFKSQNKAWRNYGFDKQATTNYIGQNR